MVHEIRFLFGFRGQLRVGNMGEKNLQILESGAREYLAATRQ